MFNVRKENENEVTAEWTVHAQLTISQPNGQKTTQQTATSSSNAPARDFCGNKENPEPEPKPITVIYQWTTDDDRNAGLSSLGIQKGNVIFKKTEKVCSKVGINASHRKNYL